MNKIVDKDLNKQETKNLKNSCWILLKNWGNSRKKSV